MASDRQARPRAHRRVAADRRRGEVIGSVVPAAAAFAATNVDDLLLLATFFAIGSTPASRIVAAQYAGIALLYGISALAAAYSAAVPAEWLRWLGVLPVAIAGKQLARDVMADVQAPPPGAIAVFAFTVASGGENLAVYIPLFTAMTLAEIILAGGVFAVMTGMWCAFALRIARQPGLQAGVKRYGRRAAPLVLIVLGAMILYGIL